MPTQSEWLRALVTNFQVDVVSSPGLMTEVQAAQQKRIQNLAARGKAAPPMKTALTTVPRFDPTTSIQVKPINLLHATGVATTPPVPNLADISSTWALIRYLWAFAPSTSPHPQLRLSTTARQIDFHQKCLLSDQLGVGFAAYLMASYLGLPDIIDVDVALRNPAWRITKQYSTSPDYICFDHRLSAPPLAVVECKGSQTSYSTVINQLRRGTEQLPSIIGQGITLDSYVVGTHFNTADTTIYILDPPSDESNLPIKHKGSEVQKLIKTLAKNVWTIEELDGFYMEIRSIAAAKRAVFAGNYKLAFQSLSDILTPQQKKQFPKMGELTTRDTDFGTFTGIATDMSYADGTRLRCFKGRQEEMDASLKLSFKDRAFETQILKTHEHVGARSYSKDGSMLEISASQS